MIIDANGKCPFEIRDSTGKEFKKIYDADGNLLFKNWNTIQGTPPIVFKGYNKTLKNYKIYGNTIQDGTPTPENPVEVQGCGERTENLFNGKIITGIIIANNGVYDKYNDSYICSENPTAVLGETTVTLSIKNHSYTGALYIIEYDENHNFLKGSGSNVISNPVFTTTLGENTRFVHVEIGNSRDKPSVEKIGGFQLEYGNVATEYEPYGYKLPVTISNGVFLDEPLRGIGEYKDTLDLSTGVVTRRIKKLVLTGEESWVYRSGKPSNTFFIEFAGVHVINNSALCTHYLNQDSVSFNDLADKHVLTRFASDGTKSYIGLRDSSFTPMYSAGVLELKEYLAAQYAAGTPVTVWYVLAEPEEETVSVPSGLSGIIEGYCIQDGTPTPENPIEVVSNGTVQSDGTYLVPRTAQSITTPIYIGSEPLHKIGDYADYIDFERGVVVRNIKKIILTGDENWINETHNANQNVYKIENFANFRTFSINGNSIGIYRCDQILYMRPPYPSGLYDRIVLMHNITRPYTLYFSTKKSMGFDTVAKFKNFLAEQYELGQPVTIWYIAAEPEEEPLGNLLSIQTIKGTNILSTNTTIQPSEIYLKGKIKSLATHMLVDSSGNVLLTSNNCQLVTKEE